MLAIITFFFSSRRRHTRSYGDWSSDVCSSDLDGLAAVVLDQREQAALADARGADHRAQRSEERRVGKEWRSRWSPSDRRKQKSGMIDRWLWVDGSEAADHVRQRSAPRPRGQSR